MLQDVISFVTVYKTHGNRGVRGRELGVRLKSYFEAELGASN